MSPAARRARALLAGLAALALLGPATAAAQEAGALASEAQRAREALARWDAGAGDPGGEALAELLELGPEAARVALEQLPEVDPPARRRRALLVRERGGADLVEPATVRLDPRRGVEDDPAVRAHLVAFLGRADLGEARLDARVGALSAVCLGDADPLVRGGAIEALAGLDADVAVAELDRLIDELPSGERLLAAAALGSLPRARHVVVERVQRGLVERAHPTFRRAPTPTDVLAVLLEGAYGRALAELPRGGRDEVDLAPFVAGLRHPDPAVRAAAGDAREDLVRRLRQLGEIERADELLLALMERGLDDRELHLQRAQLALVAGDDPAVALAVAAALDRATAAAADLHDRAWAFRAALLEACARLAAGEPEAARAPLDRAERLAEGLQRERLDTRSPARVLAQATFVEWRGLVHVGRLLEQLVAGADPGDPAVVAEALGVHTASLRTQALAALAPDSPFRSAPPVGGFDSLLGHVLSPLELVLGNPRLPAWPRPRSIEVRSAFYRALAGVAAREMPGFEPPDTDRTEPLDDPVRLQLLRSVREFYLLRVAREYSELESGDPQREVLQRLYFRLNAEKREGRERELAGLRRLRYASERALEVVQLLNAEGRNDEARRVAERMLRDAEAEPDALAAAANALLLARIELALGSARMDQGEPVEAERILLGALERLEDLERGLRTRGATAAGLQTVVFERSRILIGLAVNANVRLLDPDKALAYFERAYALRRDDFTRVLLACYRARAGREDEARALLRQISVEPANYYNLACTHALLGDREIALDFLQRELTDNHFSAGSLAQQQEWAEADPDLESLRSVPRFQALVSMSFDEARELARRSN